MNVRLNSTRSSQLLLSLLNSKNPSLYVKILSQKSNFCLENRINIEEKWVYGGLKGLNGGRVDWEWETLEKTGPNWSPGEQIEAGEGPYREYWCRWRRFVVGLLLFLSYSFPFTFHCCYRWESKEAERNRRRVGRKKKHFLLSCSFHLPAVLEKCNRLFVLQCIFSFYFIYDEYTVIK